MQPKAGGQDDDDHAGQRGSLRFVSFHGEQVSADRRSVAYKPGDERLARSRANEVEHNCDRQMMWVNIKKGEGKSWDNYLQWPIPCQYFRTGYYITASLA